MKDTEKLLAYCALGILLPMSAIVAGAHLNNNKMRKAGAVGTMAAVPVTVIAGLWGMKKQRN